MQTKHTPGPWVILRDSPPAVRTQSGESIAPEVCNLANARLIAAAPDLLAALRSILHIALLDSGPWAKTLEVEARAAIAKATGGQP